ncbi:hypothetical protein HDU80_010287 [Chytriomyces hyalinus]|nr:hypothetical protein HDU80_010287 [Chytriomyces hyalinus]
MNAYTAPASSSVLANKSSNNSVTANAADSKRLNYSAEVRSILLLWLGQNREYPYPSDAVKNDLAVKTGLTLQQVNNWFINARRRKYQFMLEDVGTAPTGSPGSSTSISTPPVHAVSQHSPPAPDTLIVSTPRLTSTGSTPSNSFSSHGSSASSSHLRASFSSTIQSPSISSDTDRRMSAAGFGPGRRRAFSGNAAAVLSGTPPSHSPYWKTAAESLALQQQHQPQPQYPPSGADHTARSRGSLSNSSNLTPGESSFTKVTAPVVIARGPSPLSGTDRPTRDLFLRQQQQQQQQQLPNQSAGLGRHQQMLQHQPYKLPAYNLSSYSVDNSGKSATTAAIVQPSPYAGNRTGTQLVVKPYVLGAGNGSAHESTQQNKLVLPLPSPPFQQQQQQQQQATHRHSISLPQPVTYKSATYTREADGFSVRSIEGNSFTMASEASAELAPLRPLLSQDKDGYNLVAQENVRLEGRPRLESMFANLSTDRSEAMNRLKGSEVSNHEGAATDAMQVDEANVHKKREVYGVGGYEVSRGCLMEGERAVAEASMRMKERDAIWGICNDD